MTSGSTILKEYPLIVTSVAFVYGALALDHVWLIGVIWSIIGMFANRGMKRLSIWAVNKYPQLHEYLDRPETNLPGMPSGQAQISASFVVFLAMWFWYYRHPVPYSQSVQILMLTVITLIGFLAMERSYLDHEHTRLQIIIGALIGGLFGLVPYYSMLKLPWKSEMWSRATTWNEFLWIVLIPVIVFVVGNFLVGEREWEEKEVEQLEIGN